MKLSRHVLGLRAGLYCGAAAGLVLAAQTQVAMAQKISSEIRGTVTGADGAPLDGAVVKVTDTRTGATLTTSTTDGGFAVNGLAIGGPYTVTVDAPGVPEKSVTGIQLSTEPSDVNIPLAAIATTETVIVSGVRTAAATAITEQHGVSTVFTQAVVAQTPTFENNLKDLMQKSPFAFVDPVGGSSNPPIATLNIAGANPRCVPLLVDGLEQSDNFGLNFNGYPTQTGPVAFPWIDQAQLIVTPYDVEYNSCGPVENIVTKQGSNDLHGGFYGSFNDQSLNGDKYTGSSDLLGNKITWNQSVKPPYRNENYGLYLSGPLVEDHLFFFVGYDEDRNTTNPGLLFAVGPTNTLGTANNPLFSKVAPDITTAEVNQVVNIAETKYGFNPGNINDSLFTEYDQKFISKLTWQINDNQKVVFSYQHTEGDSPAVNSGSTTFGAQQVTLPSNWYVNAQKLSSMTVQWFANWTDNFQTQVNVGQTSVVDNQTPFEGNAFPEMFVRVPGPSGALTNANASSTAPSCTSATSCNVPAGQSDAGYIVLGPDFSRQYNFLHYKDTFAKGLADYTIGDQTLKFGVEFHRFWYDDQFVQGATSVIRFNSISDFQNGLISQLLDGRSNAEATSLQAGNPVYFANGICTQNGATVFTPSCDDGRYRYLNGAAFIQDNWDPLPHLDITAGVRVDDYWDGDKPILNPYFTERYGFSNQKTYNGQHTVDPRISGNYDWILDDDFIPSFVPDNSDINFRGGVGKLSGGILAVWLTDSYDTTGIASVNTTGIPGTGGPGPCTSAHPYACVPTTYPGNLQTWLGDLNNGPLSTATVAKNATVNAILPGFRLPSTLYMNLGADVTFGDGWLGDGWKLTGDYLGSDDYNQPYWTNLRIEPVPGVTAPDGRLLYQWTFDQLAGRPDPAGVAGQLTGTDIGLGSMDGGHRAIFAATLSNAWTDTGYGDFTVYASYTHSHITDAGGDVASVANSVYQDRASVNYNQPEVGTSDYEREHRFTLDIDAKENFIGDLSTIIDLFAQRMSGQPFSFTFSGTPFGPAGGGVSGKSLIYVPQVDPATHLVTATSDPAVTYSPTFLTTNGGLAGFNQMLQQTGLIKYAGKIAPRNAFFGPWSTLVNLKLDQQLPMPDLVGGQQLMAEINIFNLGNLINRNWGANVEPVFYQAVPAAATTIVGHQFQYTAFTPAATLAGNSSNFNLNRQPSTYQISFAVKYQF